MAGGRRDIDVVSWCRLYRAWATATRASLAALDVPRPMAADIAKDQVVPLVNVLMSSLFELAACSAGDAILQRFRIVDIEAAAAEHARATTTASPHQGGCLAHSLTFLSTKHTIPGCM